MAKTPISGSGGGGLDVPGEVAKTQGFQEVANANTVLQSNPSLAVRALALQLRNDGYVLEASRVGLSGLRRSADSAQTRAVEEMRMLLPRLQRQLAVEGQPSSHFASGRTNSQEPSARANMGAITAGNNLAAYTAKIVETDLRTP